VLLDTAALSSQQPMVQTPLALAAHSLVLLVMEAE